MAKLPMPGINLMAILLTIDLPIQVTLVGPSIQSGDLCTTQSVDHVYNWTRSRPIFFIGTADNDSVHCGDCLYLVC